MTVIQNTAGNIIIENFYPILNVMAEVEELKCFQEEVPINGIKRFFEKTAIPFCFSLSA